MTLGDEKVVVSICLVTETNLPHFAGIEVQLFNGYDPTNGDKQVTAELAHAIDPIYPPMPTPVDPLAGVTIYTSESALTGSGSSIHNVNASDGN